MVLPSPNTWLGLVGVCVALALGGCGGSSATKTVTSTTTVTAPATSPSSGAVTPNPSSGRDYPASFNTSFMRSCDRRASAAKCGCALTYIKAHATYAQVVKDVIAGNFVDGPVYRASILTCISR